MKRSGPPARRTPLRANPETVRAWKERTTRPLPAKSERRRALDPVRAAVRDAAIARDGGCVARGLIPGVGCWSPFPDRPTLEVDEVVPRGRGGSPYDLDNVQTLCQRHHDWKHDNPAEAARLGLMKSAEPVRCRWCGEWTLGGSCPACGTEQETRP